MGIMRAIRFLRYFGNALREIFEGKGIAIRSGGDEFIVLLEEMQRDRIEQYMQAVLDKIRQYNGGDNVLYEIHFSYGVAILDQTQEDINEFIRQSDKYMYDEKLKKAALTGQRKGSSERELKILSL